MSRNCPDCRQPLNQQTFHDIMFELCPECEGIWFDQDELRRLLAADKAALNDLQSLCNPSPAPHTSPKGVLFCPGCDGLLRAYHFQYNSPVELQACLDCGGFWIDENQLAAMQQWHDTHLPGQHTHAVVSVPAQPTAPVQPAARIHVAGGHRSESQPSRVGALLGLLRARR